MQDNSVSKNEDAKALRQEALRLIKEESTEGGEALLGAVDKFRAEFVDKHPKKVMLRKHINWNRISEIMQENGVAHTPELLKQMFYLLCRHVQVERVLSDLVTDVRAYLSKAAQPKLITPYQYFKKHMLERKAAKFESKSAVECQKILGEKWRGLSEKKLARYQTKAQKHNEEMLKNNPEFFQKKRKRSKNGTPRKSFVPDVEPPPESVLAFYIKQFPNEGFKSPKEHRNAATSSWNALPTEDLQRFCREFDESKIRYNEYVSTLSPTQLEKLQKYVETKAKRRPRRTNKN